MWNPLGTAYVILSAIYTLTTFSILFVPHESMNINLLVLFEIYIELY